MKLNLLLIFLLAFSTLIDIQAQTAFDTVETTNVAPGVVYRRIIAPAVPWSINMLEIDLTNSNNFFQTVKATDKLEGFETVSSMAARNSYDGHRVIGAVNGDFYNTGNGTPTNMQISNGEIVKGSNGRPVIGLNNNYIPFIDQVTYSGKITDRDSSLSIYGINSDRGTNQLILYNHFYGASTGTNNFGTEISLSAIDNWLVNDTVRCIVMNKEDGIGNMIISDSTAVLSGHGTAKVFLDSVINIGDTIKIINNLSISLPKIKELVGGNPKLVVNGNNLGDNVSREPRTAIGFSKDTTKLYIFAVDGRRGGFSAGMTFSELADFMIANGVDIGLNLDGGASTTMVLRDSIVNMPSGGYEREVSNSLLLLTKAGKGTLNSVQVSPDYFKLYKEEKVQFRLQGFDEFYNLMTIDPANVQYSLSHNFGTLTSNGSFTAGNQVDTGFVFASYNGFKDSALIIIKGITKLSMLPKEAVTDTIRSQEFNIKSYDSEGIERNIVLSDFSWSLSDSSIGVIDSIGNFKGTAPGMTKVIASYNNLSDTSLMEVVIKHGNHLIDSLDNLDNWSIMYENLDTTGSNVTISNNELTQGSGSCKIDYKFIYDSGKLNYIYLNTNYPLSGVPDSVVLDAKSDGQKHLLSYIFENQNHQQFSVPVKKYFEIADRFDTMGGALKDATPLVTGSLFNYPVTLKQIIIKLASSRQSGQVYSGTLYLDNLRVSYPDSIVTSIINANYLPSQFSLSQNYPNPFNPSTNIKFNIKKEGIVSLKIYDILGREVATLVNEKMNAGKHIVIWNAENLASGIYIYRLQQEGNYLSRKMILLK